MTIQEQLERLHNRPTRYEVIAEGGDLRCLIAYISQRSRSGLLSACRGRAQDIIRALGLKESDMLIPARKASDGFALGAWRVRFSGRTQRDAICNGELPWVGDLAKLLEVA